MVAPQTCDCPNGLRNWRGPCQCSRARAAPPRWERPTARNAQRCESGGKAPKATQGGYSATVWRTACSQFAISSCARALLSVGTKRRSARHSCESSSVLRYTPLDSPAR